MNEDARLTDPEIRITHQESTLQSLNDVVAEQQQLITQLRKELEAMKTRLRDELLLFRDHVIERLQGRLLMRDADLEIGQACVFIHRASPLEVFRQGRARAPSNKYRNAWCCLRAWSTAAAPRGPRRGVGACPPPGGARRAAPRRAAPVHRGHRPLARADNASPFSRARSCRVRGTWDRDRRHSAVRPRRVA